MAVSTVPGSGGQLRFDVQRTVLGQALQRFGNRPSKAVGRGGLTFDIAMLFSAGEREAVEANSKFRVELNRLIRNTGQRLVERARKVSYQTRKTDLFWSSWAIERETTAISGLNSKISLTNKAPYALYVHRKGTPKSATVVNKYIKPLVRKAIDEIVDDVTSSSRLRQLIARQIVGRAAP